MLLNCGVGEDSWESLGLQGDPTSPSFLGVHWRDWCWSWNSNTLSTWCEELTPWKRPWFWERLKARGEGDARVSWGSWWWTGRSGVLQSMGSQRVSHDWATELTDTVYWQCCILLVFLIVPMGSINFCPASFFTFWKCLVIFFIHFSSFIFSLFWDLVYNQFGFL